MTDAVPFCERCGRPGPSLSGVHPGSDGLVRWTLYRCGHVRQEIVYDDVEQHAVVQELGAR